MMDIYVNIYIYMLHLHIILFLVVPHLCFLWFFTDLHLSGIYDCFKEDFRPLFTMCFVFRFSSCSGIGSERDLNCSREMSRRNRSYGEGEHTAGAVAKGTFTEMFRV